MVSKLGSRDGSICPSFTYMSLSIDSGSSGESLPQQVKSGIQGFWGLL